MKQSINLIADPLKVSADGQLIPNAAAIRMINYFQWGAGPSVHTTYAVHFLMDDYTNIGKLLSLAGSDGFGLYFAEYPVDGSLDPVGKNYKDRYTIIVVPTKDGKPLVDLHPPTIPSADLGSGDDYDHGELEP